MITFSEVLNEPLLLIIQMIIVILGAVLFPTRWEVTSKFKKQIDHKSDIEKLEAQNKENLKEVKESIKEHISSKIDTLDERFNTVREMLDAIKDKR